MTGQAVKMLRERFAAAHIEGTQLERIVFKFKEDLPLERHE
jgi:hypothetical protein